MAEAERKIRWMSHIRRQKTKADGVKYYTKFKFGKIVAGIGDHVLTVNVDGSQDIGAAKILKLFETKSEYNQFRAIVRHYSFRRHLPPIEQWMFSANIKCKPKFHDKEVIEDCRKFNAEISIENIYSTCKIIVVEQDAPLQRILDRYSENRTPVFVCRYKLLPVHCKESPKFCLVPAGELKMIQRKSKMSASSVSRRRTGEEKPLPLRIKKLTYSDISSLVNQETDHSCKDDETDESCDDDKSFASEKDSSMHTDCTLTKSAKESAKLEKLAPEKNMASDQCYQDDANCRFQKQNSDDKLSINIKSDHGPPNKKVKIECDTEYKAEKNKYSQNSQKVISHRKLEVNIRQSEKLKPKQIFRSVDSHSKSERVMPPCEMKVDESVSKPRRFICDTQATRISLSPTGLPQAAKSVLVHKEEEILEYPIKETISKLAEEKNRKRKRDDSEEENSYQNPPEEVEIPQPLLCRTEEFTTVFNFVQHKIVSGGSGCIYISGVPGTGKTATVERVIKCLEAFVERKLLPRFKYIHVNGMKLSEPRRVYVKIWEALTGKAVSINTAETNLSKRFKSHAPRRLPTVLLVDELDTLTTKRQDVMYNIMDWSTYKSSGLTIIAIANTMDLPERCLKKKVSSRLGLSRLTFQPYSHRQLQEIISSNLQEEYNNFESDAVELISRKVASLTGDVRRAFDILERAVDLAKRDSSPLTMKHAENVIDDMMSNKKIAAIRALSVMMKIFLRGVIAEMDRTGNEEVQFIHVMNQMKDFCIVEGYKPLEQNQCMILFNCLTARGLIRRPKVFPISIHTKLLLNASVDEVHYALNAEMENNDDGNSSSEDEHEKTSDDEYNTCM